MVDSVVVSELLVFSVAMFQPAVADPVTPKSHAIAGVASAIAATAASINLLSFCIILLKRLQTP
jgi:hypothetical protein